MSVLAIVTPPAVGTTGSPFGRGLNSVLAAQSVDRVVVAVGDAHAEACLRLGIEVVPTAGGTVEVALRALEDLQQSGSLDANAVVIVRADANVTADDVEGVVAAFSRTGADTVLGIARVVGTLWRVEAGGGVRMDPDPTLFRETSDLYAVNPIGFLAIRRCPFGAIAFHEVNPERTSARSGDSLLPPRLRAIALDFDGVFTDNRVLVFDDGREAVVCNRSDGWGIAALRDAGWPLIVVSTETNPVVATRCRKLRIECVQGVADKVKSLTNWLAGRGIPLEETLYLGNDVNDVPCLRSVGVPAVVADAHLEARRWAVLVLASPGGSGALRELADLILARYGRIDA
jgi:N-acylneuraminate cytidylyltransferase